ncbi:hypothetical protein [Okeania sp. KiyG1]|nr:hypothetical protein [Okeania sp. KiyG1]
MGRVGGMGGVGSFGRWGDRERFGNGAQTTELYYSEANGFDIAI